MARSIIRVTPAAGQNLPREEFTSAGLPLTGRIDAVNSRRLSVITSGDVGWFVVVVPCTPMTKGLSSF